MDLLIKKLKSSLMCFGIALALAVILPIVLKNAFACSVGIAAMLLFGYQSIMCYKAIKNNDYICIKAECVKTSFNGLGAATYARKCVFKPLDGEIVSGEIMLQIANDLGNKRNGTKVYSGGKYELVFKKAAFNNDAPYDMSGFSNATLITYGPLSYFAKGYFTITKGSQEADSPDEKKQEHKEIKKSLDKK